MVKIDPLPVSAVLSLMLLSGIGAIAGTLAGFSFAQEHERKNGVKATKEVATGQHVDCAGLDEGRVAVAGTCQPRWGRDVARLREARTSPRPGPTVADGRGHNAVEMALERIWWAESRCGKDPRAGLGQVGLAGERGSWQITPRFAADLERLTGRPCNVHDVARCKEQIRVWLEYYGPRVGARTSKELAELYRRGPKGYRQWRNR